MRQRHSQRMAWALILVVMAVLVGMFFTGALTARAAPAYDLEAGYQTGATPAPYVLGRVNLPLGEIPLIGTQFWLLPEAGAVFRDPVETYGRVQLLADTRLFTVGADVKTGHDAWMRVFIRLNL